MDYLYAFALLFALSLWGYTLYLVMQQSKKEDELFRRYMKTMYDRKK